MNTRFDPRAALREAFAALARGDAGRAEQLSRQVLEHLPDDFNALHLRGLAHWSQGHPRDAAASLDRAVAVNPASPEAWNNRCVVLHAIARYQEAAASCDRAIALKPDYAEAYYNRGNALQALKRHEEAIASFDGAVARQPGYAEAFNNRGGALQDLKRWPEALASYDRAIALRPDYAEAHNNRGSALQDVKRWSEAVASYDQAISLRPGYAEAWNNRGVALRDLGRPGEALANLEQAIALMPDYADALANRGNALKDLGRAQDALASYDRAIALRPGFADARLNRAVLRLALGDFAGGWEDYEWRIAARSGMPYLADPRALRRTLPRPSSLLPLDLAGRRLVLLPDQGLGDELFFLRFAGAARARGARLEFQASPAIASIVERALVVDRVLASASEAGEPGGIFSVGDLPLIVGAGDGWEPPPPLRMAALPQHIEAARTRLREIGAGPYLAVTWRGGTLPVEKAGRRTLFKEVDRAALAAALREWRGEVVAVQRNPHAGEVEQLSALLGRRVHDFSALNEDLEAMLALLGLLDDYVGVSNTNMHLRAGLGLPARVLIPHPPEWRWAWEGAASPWFPGFRLYREAPGGGMERALELLAADLRRA